MLAVTAILLPIAALAFLIFVTLPLPLYLGGKISKLHHEKFTYTSCIWTGFATGVVSGILYTILGTIYTAIVGSVPVYVGYTIGLGISYFILRYFLIKHYSVTEKQAGIMFISTIIIGVLLSMAASFIAVILGTSLGIGMMMSLPK